MLGLNKIDFSCVIGSLAIAYILFKIGSMYGVYIFIFAVYWSYKKGQNNPAGVSTAHLANDSPVQIRPVENYYAAEGGDETIGSQPPANILEGLDNSDVNIEDYEVVEK